MDLYEGLIVTTTLCKLAAEISLSIVFPFAYLQHSPVVGEKICLLCLKACVSSMQVAFLNICSALRLFRAPRYIAGCFTLLRSSLLQGCVESSSTTQGRLLQSSVAESVSGSIPLAYCCCATMTLYSWEVDFSRQQVIWLNVGKVSVLKELLVFPRTEMG